MEESVVLPSGLRVRIRSLEQRVDECYSGGDGGSVSRTSVGLVIARDWEVCVDITVALARHDPFPPHPPTAAPRPPPGRRT